MSKQASKNPSGSWNLILLLIIAGIAVLSLSPVSAEKPVVTIVAKGDQSYYMGEKVVFGGTNTGSDSTYLFITGPNLPEGGGKLSSPSKKAVTGDDGSFTVVKTNPDATWEYAWYTSSLMLDAGTYTIYAVTKPESKDQFNDATTYGTVSIIYKKPFIMAKISSYNVIKGQPFTVTGTAVTDGNPSHVQIWILGDTSAIIIKNPVNPDGSFTFTADEAISGKLSEGKHYLIVEHPMADKQSDFVVSGDYVRDLKRNNGTDLFRLTGPGSLQGANAADALTAAISEREAHDNTHTNDTYTLIPFQVTDTRSPTTGVTIAASGTQSYYQGEKVVFSGSNYDSDTTYLFITGPGTFVNGPGVPENGGKLTAPRQNVVSGNPGSFDTATTKADKSWEYVYYTHNLNVNAGTYTVYAVSQPNAKDQVNSVNSANVSIILKKPFLTGEISPASISKGEPFTVSGTAEGDPESVRIWILGNTYYSRATESVNPDVSFRYEVPRKVTSQLESGQYFAIVQHPMQNTQFDIDVTGDYVRNLNLNNGTDLFRISGPGSLQGSDAADALVAALSDQKTNDDTYTLIPFQVTDAGNPGASAGTGVSGTGITISADGDKSYYMGEKVVLRGRSPDADTVYLFMTGPTEVLPAAGVKLTSSDKAVVSGNPDSFTIVKTKPDKTWEYSFYTANLINPDTVAGTYTIYAVNQPKAKDQLGSDAANVGIILKKPFITAEIPSSTVVKGQPFSVTGTAEGIPPEVRIWIIGDAYAYTTKTPVNQNDASFTFTADTAMSGKLPAGQNYLIVQHPMSDNQFDFIINGDYVRNLKLNNGTNVFKLTGPGSLQGSDAAEALITAINEQEANDKTYTNDMYTIVPFKVTDA